jgi:uncharacterized protein RhaS with RHS repeats
MWIKLTPNECIERALQAPCKSHERGFWFELAGLMIEVDKPLHHSSQYEQGGLTLATGSLYRQQAGQAHRGKIERTNQTGTSY